MNEDIIDTGMELSAPSNTVQTETSTFQGEKFAAVNQVREDPQFSHSSEEMLGDVRNMLKRPKFVGTYNPEFIGQLGDDEPIFDLDWNFFESNFQIGSRFAGALGFRATTCFRVVLAAAPQVGGRGRMYYNPSKHVDNVLSTNRNTEYMSKPNYYTQLPGVEMDFSKDTAVDFKVKYTSYLEYMPIFSSEFEDIQHMTLGEVSYTQYLPVGRAVTTSSPRVTIYTWLEDLEIIGARNPDLVKTDFEAGTVVSYDSMTIAPTDLTGFTFGTLTTSDSTGTASEVYEFELGGVYVSRDAVVTGYATKLPGKSASGAVVYATTSGSYVGPIVAVTKSGSTTQIEWQDVSGGVGNMFAEFGGAAVVAQSGGPSKEEDTQRSGPLSGPLYAISKVTGVLGKIPLLRDIAGPVSWATRVAGNVVAAFGYSRPLQLEQNARFWQSQNHYQNNADGPDTSFNMGLLQDNKLGLVTNMGGVDIDEMAIDFVATRPAFLGYFKVGTTNSGLQAMVSLCPEAMYSVNQILTSSTILSRPPIHWLDPKNVSFSAGLEQPFFLENGLPVDTTPNFMLGTMFKYFRGGFKFKVKCNKTRFHAGRLALVFTPYTDISHSDRKLYVPEQTEMDLYSQVTIWDLREDNEIEFECPYIYNKPYCEVGEPYGVFTIHMVDRLTAPDNVDNFVEFAIEVVAQDGMEYAFPSQGDYIVDPAIDFRSEQVGGYKLPESELVVSQSGGPINQGNHDKIEPDCACIGERVLSLKQMISRAEWSSLYPYTQPYKPVKLPMWFETPSFIGKYNTVSGSRHIGSFKKSSRAIITNCYLFARGSTCYDVMSFDQSPLTGQTDDITHQRPETFVTLVDEDDPSNGLLGTGSVICEAGPYNHFKVPFYSQTKKIMVNPCVKNINDTGTIVEYTSIDAQAFARPVLYGPQNSKFSIRAGDDAQLAYYLCSTPLVYVRGGPFNAPSLGSTSAIGGAVDAYQLAPRYPNLPL